jgi:hypothetical protein
MWRHLLIFLALGSVLVAARRAVSAHAPERPELVVRVPADASDGEMQRSVDDAVLVDAAVRSGWARTDPLVIDRLRRNMRFAEGDVASNAVDRALALGMHRSDPIVRRRLAKRTRDVLSVRSAQHPPSDDELLAYARAHRHRFERPATVSFSHVLLSRQRHEGRLEADVRMLRTRLSAATRGEGERLSDPWLHPYRFDAINLERIDAHFGVGFARQLSEARERAWVGPLRSSFGLHFVWIEGRTDRLLPPLASMRAALTDALEQEQRPQALRDGLASLRAGYHLVVERAP